ncbi:hypothetical protein M0812_28929 [Anaeramoeba flamelloides]|uniref:Uncharacterized protein n=1 Tax=Anaeramoeba flamelloides TaxID=1746091 RepID=A0AAV7Y9K5_9EUKA|nr:hypothetical protein M0812_28929 [Anaeramoeba flamelloides]
MKERTELQDFHYPRKFETPTKTKNFAETNEKDDLITFLLRIQILIVNYKHKKNKMQYQNQNQNQIILLFQNIFFQTKEMKIISKCLFSNLQICITGNCFNVKKLQLKPSANDNDDNNFSIIPDNSKTGQIKSSNFKKLLIYSKPKLCEEYIGFLNIYGSPFADSFLILPILEQERGKGLKLWKHQLNTFLKNTEYGSNLWKLNNNIFLKNLKKLQKPKYLIVLIQSKCGEKNPTNILIEWKKIKNLIEFFPFVFIIISDVKFKKKHNNDKFQKDLIHFYIFSILQIGIKSFVIILLRVEFFITISI